MHAPRAKLARRHSPASVSVAREGLVCILTERDVLDSVGAGQDPDSEVATVASST